jgi:HPt (histidine-containing phosphotransfer) domain-containing protein
LEQLRDITLNDAELMREVIAALIEDTSRQIGLIEVAIREQDSQKCIQLAHYSKGACANLGANSAAALLKQIERDAAGGDFAACGTSLVTLARDIDRLRAESANL